MPKRKTPARDKISAAIDAMIAARSGTAADAKCACCLPAAPIFPIDQFQVLPPEFIENSWRRLRASGLFDGLALLRAE